VQLAKVSIHDWLGRRYGARLADVCQETLATECGPAAVFLGWYVWLLYLYPPRAA
jgi:hypothetical protein